jgi:hypothetical protein
MKLDFLRKIFEKYENIKFQENPSSECPVVSSRLDGPTDGQIDMTKLIELFAILRMRLKSSFAF